MTRQMVDKRQSRKVNRQAFCNALDEWRTVNPPEKSEGGSGTEAAVRAPLGDLTQPGVSPKEGTQRRLRAIVRKRPLFSYEQERGEFDVVSVRGGGSSVIVHNCCMQPDLKRMFVKHTSFAHIGDCFDESVKTPEVRSSSLSIGSLRRPSHVQLVSCPRRGGRCRFSLGLSRHDKR